MKKQDKEFLPTSLFVFIIIFGVVCLGIMIIKAEKHKALIQWLVGG